MKKALSFLLSLVLIITAFAALPANAFGEITEGYCGENIKYTYNSATGKLVLSGSGSTYNYNYNDENNQPIFSRKDLFDVKSLVIEEGVTAIGKNTFKLCKNLSSISLPESLKSIGANAFDSCKSLKAVNIPDGVENIGKNAFAYNIELTKITLSKNLIKIDNGAFFDCEKLVSIKLPDTLKTIGDGAFAECSALTSFTVPSSVNKIGLNPVWGCTGLAALKVDTDNPYFDSRDNSNAVIRKTDNALIAGCKTTIIPDSVTFIDKRAFSSCKELDSIKIPDSVTGIGEYAFFSCEKLKNIVVPESVNTLGESAFSQCYALKTATVFGAAEISKSAFDNCKSLKRVWIKSGTKTIDEYAFAHCPKIDSIQIPNTLTAIKGNAFAESSVNKVFFTGSKEEWNQIEILHNQEYYNGSDFVISDNAAIVNAKKYYNVCEKHQWDNGKITKTATFKAVGHKKYTCTVCKITKTDDVKKLTSPALSSVKKGKKAFTALWKKASGVSGYQIQYAANSKFTKSKNTVTVKGNKKTKLTVKRLNKNKKYYVRIRAYKTINGKKQYSKWSKAKSVKTK